MSLSEYEYMDLSAYREIGRGILGISSFRRQSQQARTNGAVSSLHWDSRRTTTIASLPLLASKVRNNADSCT